MFLTEIEKRASGRTSRMVDHATRLAAAGRPVCVVLCTTAQCEYWKEKTVHRLHGDVPGLRFETEETLGDDLDWKRLKLQGQLSCVLLIDHAVIESKFRNIFVMWQQYDGPRSQKTGERFVDGTPARQRSIDAGDATHPVQALDTYIGDL